MTKTITHWIDGGFQKGQSGRYGPVFDPATGAETARVAFASVEDVDLAVASALAAFPDWRDTSISARASILFQFRNLLHEARDELAGIIASEHGKTRPDARGEVQRGLETVEFASKVTLYWQSVVKTAHGVPGCYCPSAPPKV